MGAAVVQAQGVLGVEDTALNAALTPGARVLLRTTHLPEDLLTVEAAGAKRQRDPPVGAGESDEGGVGAGGDIEKDRAAPAGGQGGDILLAEAQGGGLGCDEVKEHGKSFVAAAAAHRRWTTGSAVRDGAPPHIQSYDV